ncbi:Rieske (2Fe-2S) domain protein [Leptolyngbya sp. NIES-3755]|nr:Rieske (2Fe-2S) domain protein [Leptolyngbya sp. NIES-3755]
MRSRSRKKVIGVINLFAQVMTRITLVDAANSAILLADQCGFPTQEKDMELSTALSGEIVQNAVREVGINPNYWYAIAWSKDVKREQAVSIQIWEQEISLSRNHQQQAIAKDQSRGYPVQEKYGIVWLFLGNPTHSEHQPLPVIPEFDDPSYLMLQVSVRFKAHFSICNENTMDVFRSYLHQNLQGWFDPALIKLIETENSVTADYRVSYKGLIPKRFEAIDSNGTTKLMSIHYCYPNYVNRLEDLSALYLMRLPISRTESRSFSILLLKSPVPRGLLAPLRPILQLLIVRLLFLRFLKQDTEMIESEQENYLKNPQRRYVEVNPAVIALQRLMMRQYKQYLRS